MNHWTLGISFLVASGGALAQSANPYDGTWKATWAGQTRPLEAVVVINGSGGSWKTFSSSRSNPCVGREAPILVTTASNEALVFTAKFSRVLATCDEFDVTLKPDGEVLRGTRGALPVELRRK